MKKSLIFLSLLTSLSTVSCGSEVDTSPIALDYGYVGKSNITNIYDLDIGYSRLTSLVNSGENFVLLIYHNTGCTCWTSFSPLAIKFMNTYHTRFYVFDNALLDGETNSFGIYKGLDEMPGICFFRRGKLIRQSIYGLIKNEKDKRYFKDLASFEEYMLSNIYLPKMYYLDKEVLDTKINNNEDFNLYVARSECDDCKAANKTVLYKWSDSLKNKALTEPLYIFDIEPYRGTEEYQTIKDTYGLSNTTFNPIFGYDTGMVPTFQRWSEGHVVDMITILNDKLGENNTLSSYFTEERVNASPMMRDTGIKYILDGNSVDEKDIGNYPIPGSEIIYKYIYRDSQLKWHTPMLELYLSTYIK